MNGHYNKSKVSESYLVGNQSEWQQGWLLVLACTFGFAFYSVLPNAMGLFVDPLKSEFGWSHSKIFLGMSITSILTIFLSPIIGAGIDKYGVRVVALPGLIMTSLCIASLSFATGSIFQWVILWIFLGLSLILIKTTVWTAAITGSFKKSRSMAIAFAISGTALASIIVPPLAQMLISAYGWRLAIIYIGLGFGLVTFTLSLFFLRDNRHRINHEKCVGSEESTVRGLSVSEAMSNSALIKIFLSSIITMFVGVGIAVNQVPIIVQSGVTREEAAYLASLYGIAGVVGKFATGWLMQKMHAGIVGGVTLTVAAFSYLLLIDKIGSTLLIMVGLCLIGYSNGSKLQISAYLTSVYGGVSNYGKIFGLISSGIALGGGLGPLFVGVMYDLTGSHTAFLLFGVFASLISAYLLFTLGETPDSTSSYDKTTS